MGKLYEQQYGFPTPDDIPEDLGCRQFSIPSDPVWFALLMGAVLPLADEKSWYQWGDMTPAEAAAAWTGFIDAAYDGVCEGTSLIPTPFWDEVTETDDEFSPEEQPWYGYVDDPELPADELTFIESAGIWAFTGFLALSGTPAAAILFNTTAKSFVLAMRGDDFAEVIRVIIDGYEQVVVDTEGLEGELIEIPCVADPDLETHSVLLVKLS